MDINTLGIGGIIGATLVASLNLYIFLSNRKKDEIKERIEKLYSPLYVYYLEYTRYGSKEPYKDYLIFKKIYIQNSIYASDILKELFEELLHNESEFRDLREDERAKKMMNSSFRNDKGLEVDLKDMIYRVSGCIDRDYYELQIYYAKGFLGRFLWRLNDSNRRGLSPAGRSFE